MSQRPRRSVYRLTVIRWFSQSYAAVSLIMKSNAKDRLRLGPGFFQARVLRALLGWFQSSIFRTECILNLCCCELLFILFFVLASVTQSPHKSVLYLLINLFFPASPNIFSHFFSPCFQLYDPLHALVVTFFFYLGTPSRYFVFITLYICFLNLVLPLIVTLAFLVISALLFFVAFLLLFRLSDLFCLFFQLSPPCTGRVFSSRSDGKGKVWSIR